MTDNITIPDISSEIPLEVLSNPSLLFLYYRIEKIFGIKSKNEPLIKLNEYIEENCGFSFTENPAAYEYFLGSKEHIYNFSKFITINETYFFREGVHFKLLEDLLPDFVKLKRPVQICCAAVSIGCEAYSIAMLFDHNKKNGLDIEYSIDAFDVSNTAIETAKKGRYTANSFRNDGSDWKSILDSYLEPNNSDFIIKQNIQEKVNFFTHNIMESLDKQYDIIFFKNALIYFSSVNRLNVINNLSNSLFPGGLLFLGVSETSSINHPLLFTRYSSDTFYFQKAESIDTIKQFNSEQNTPVSKSVEQPHRKRIKPKSADYTSVKKELAVNYTEITDILKNEEGKNNAECIFDMITNENTGSVSGSCLAAAVIYCLNNQDFHRADKILSFLEKYNTGACPRFLRGEYYFFLGNSADAEKYYQEASLKDKYFWPAFYRISVLSSEGNQTRYEYKIKKAMESIENFHKNGQSKEMNYECFLGGFSSDYFLRILEKKLAIEV
jgi:chemotaxis protein methyltransferase CheR